MMMITLFIQRHQKQIWLLKNLKNVPKEQNKIQYHFLVSIKVSIDLKTEINENDIKSSFQEKLSGKTLGDQLNFKSHMSNL